MINRLIAKLRRLDKEVESSGVRDRRLSGVLSVGYYCVPPMSPAEREDYDEDRIVGAIRDLIEENHRLRQKIY